MSIHQDKKFVKASICCEKQVKLQLRTVGKKLIYYLKFVLTNRNEISSSNFIYWLKCLLRKTTFTFFYQCSD